MSEHAKCLNIYAQSCSRVTTWAKDKFKVSLEVFLPIPVFGEYALIFTNPQSTTTKKTYSTILINVNNKRFQVEKAFFIQLNCTE